MQKELKNCKYIFCFLFIFFRKDDFRINNEIKKKVVSLQSNATFLYSHLVDK